MPSSICKNRFSASFPMDLYAGLLLFIIQDEAPDPAEEFRGPAQCCACLSAAQQSWGMTANKLTPAGLQNTGKKQAALTAII